MSLSYNIKCYRRSRGLSQEFVADSLCMTQSTYSRIEKCEEACIERLLSIAKALDTTPQILRSFHLNDEVDLSEITPTVSSLLEEKESIIEAQAIEIKFLRRQIEYHQAVWNQYCKG